MKAIARYGKIVMETEKQAVMAIVMRIAQLVMWDQLQVR